MPRKTDIAVMIAVRSGSKRVPRKNVRSFCNSSLLEIKIKQAMRLKDWLTDIKEYILKHEETS